MCSNLTEDEIRDSLLQYAYDTESIVAYGFASYMNRKHESVFWVKLLYEIITNPLCFLEGAYLLALLHARELVHLLDDVESMEKIIFLHNIPEKIVSDEEAYRIAKKMLTKDSENQVALDLLKKLQI